MKRTIYIFLALSVLLNAACTEIETRTTPQHPESQYPYIFFDAEVLQTKSNLITGASLPTAPETAFGVFGYRETETETETVFENEEMYRPSGGGAFIYDNLVTWTDAQHDFFAYYPYDANAEIGFDTGEPYITYTQPTSLDAMVDIMTASTTIEKPSGTAVPLVFQHRLFALDVIIKNGQIYDTDEPLTITAATVTFSVPQASTLYYTANEEDILKYENDGSVYVTWTLPESNQPIEINAEKSAVLNNPTGKKDYNSFLFLPCESISVNISLQGEDYWGKLGTYDSEKDGYYLIGSAQIGPFIAGKRYTLEITKKDAEGFVGNLVDWKGSEINFTFK